MSYEKTSRYNETTDSYENWAANNDDGYGTPLAPDGGKLFADITGAGYISRIWSAEPRSERIKIFIDGSENPSVNMPFNAFFGGTAAPFNNSVFCYESARGKNSYILITFNSSCRMVAYGDWGRYYQINYTLLEEGKTVEPFDLPLTIKQQETLNQISRRMTEEKSFDSVQTTTIPARTSDSIFEDAVTGEITEIAVKINGFENEGGDFDALAELAIFAYWDGEEKPSVWSTLGGFFGSITGLNESESLPMGVTSNDVLYCRFVMPYSDGAKLVLINDGEKDYNVRYSVKSNPLEKPVTDSLLRFHAKWTRLVNPPKGQRWPDSLLLHATGSGRFVRTSLHIYNGQITNTNPNRAI